MSRRVNALKQKIVENIRNRTPGFRESVPSIRDLISRFDETHHVVNSALKELVDDGVLNCVAGKGFFIARETPAPTETGEAGPRELEVVVMEKMIWQIDFWCAVFRMFSDAYPQFRVSPRFLWNNTDAIAFLQGQHPDRSTVVLCMTNKVARSVPLIPPPELERMLGMPLTGEPLLPGLESYGDGFRVYYQLQPSLWFYRLGRRPPRYDWHQGLYGLLESMAEVPDSVGKLSPLSISFALSTLGIDEENDLNCPELTDKLRELARCFAFTRDHRLLNLELPNEAMTEIRELREGNLYWVQRNSFYAGAVGLSQRLGKFGLMPPPVRPGEHFQIPVCSAAVAGTRCTPGCAEFIRFLLSRPVQELMMQRGLGFSPFPRYLEAALADEKHYPEGLPEVIGFIREQIPLRHKRNFESDAIFQELADQLVMPILTGESFPEERIRQLAAGLRRQVAAQPGGDKLSLLRQRLLQQG